MIERLLGSAVVAIFALVGVLMMRIYLGKRKIRSDFGYAMQVVAKEAVRRAQAEHRVVLDFAPASIEGLEEMLGSIHEGHLKNPPGEHQECHLRGRLTRNNRNAPETPRAVLLFRLSDLSRGNRAKGLRGRRAACANATGAAACAVP
jgi:hypothetical protein